jgi:hypothetical protein
MSLHYVYTFQAELCDYLPKIWRRFDINGEKTIAELGYALMVMFEMLAKHKFCFTDNSGDHRRDDLLENFSKSEIGEKFNQRLLGHKFQNAHYALMRDDILIGENKRFVEAGKIRLTEIAKTPGWKLKFEYDYEDGWQVNLELLSCEKREALLRDLPCVHEGEGFGILEDSGGVWGLREIARVLKGGTRRELLELCSWLGTETLDLEAFDKDDVNVRLKSLMPVYKKKYEYNVDLSESMLALVYRMSYDKDA